MASYKRVSSVNSPLNLTASSLDALNVSQNGLALDIDLSTGNVVINLPSITSLLFGGSNGNPNSGAGGFTFYIRGTVL